MIKKLMDFCKQNENIFCYGAGLYGREIRVFLEENGISLNGFVMTGSSDKQNILQKPVYNINKIIYEKEKNECGFIVGVSLKYQEEIVAELKQRNIHNYFLINEKLMQYIRKNTNYISRYNDNNINVLLYHRVIDLEYDPQLLAVSPDHFEQQIKYLKENYNILRFEDDWSNVNEQSVVITFDDGYVDNYKYALPILEKYEIPATIFISTGNIGTNREFWWDNLERLFLLNKNLPSSINIDRYCFDLNSNNLVNRAYNEFHLILKKMSAIERNHFMEHLEKILLPDLTYRDNYRSINVEELKSLASSPYITIGGHTVSHAQMSSQTIIEQEYEIKESKIILENILNKKITAFSYPFGGKNDYTDDTIKLLKKYNYYKVAANYPGLVGDKNNSMEIPRNIVRNWDIELFAKEIRKAWCV